MYGLVDSAANIRGIGSGVMELIEALNKPFKKFTSQVNTAHGNKQAFISRLAVHVKYGNELKPICSQLNQG